MGFSRIDGESFDLFASGENQYYAGAKKFSAIRAVNVLIYAVEFCHASIGHCLME